MSFARILIAVDQSAFAAHAANIGIELAKSLGAELAFIHVVDTAVASAAPDVGLPADKLIAMEKEEAKRLLSAFRERAGTSPLALEFLEMGKPATKIVDAAKSWPADLIVIGSHGRGGVERLLLGSVAESVVRHASCPVLVVRRAK
ncbi:MAG TPA: universal stress protein [Candidatus Acidoferrales bacterium]|nr:universal stress protein [Candidatus Acidoferrales bacterium]